MSFVELSEVLGNMAEFVGAPAVVLTLFYLAIQVKHSKEATEANTRALDEDRKIALAQAYHARAVEAAANVRMLADSPVASIFIKYRESGIDSLAKKERFRLGLFQSNNMIRLDSNHFAFEQSLLPEYGSDLESGIRTFGPIWRELGISVERESFRQEIDRIMKIEDEEASKEAPKA